MTLKSNFYKMDKIRFISFGYLIFAIFFFFSNSQMDVGAAKNIESRTTYENQISNLEEIINSSEISGKLEVDDLTELLSDISDTISKEEIDPKEELKNIIEQKTRELGLSTTDEDVNDLESIISGLENMDIDWGEFRSHIEEIHDNVNEFISSDEGQNFIHSILDVLVAFIELLRNLLTP
ncbi:DUF1002 domain-containing protein [Evansella sp. AB-rgal1]|uniref:DUF1002 domain-containing protein n=1 Tax=Evansella sp. AB-rgal1 TaxID=3242696 RepID=UPI00359D51BE